MYQYELTYDDYHEASLAGAVINAQENARESRQRKFSGVRLLAFVGVVFATVFAVTFSRAARPRIATPPPQSDLYAWLELAPFVAAFIFMTTFGWAARAKTAMTRRVMVATFILTLVAAGYCIWLRLSRQNLDYTIIVTPWFLILLWGFRLVRTLGSHSTMKRQWAKTTILHGPRSMTIVEDGIILEDETNSTHVKWPGITKISETLSELLLWQGVNFHILPKRAIGDAAAVRRCREHLEEAIKRPRAFAVVPRADGDGQLTPVAAQVLPVDSQG